MEKVIENIEKYISLAVVALYPIFVLSFFSNPYVISKELFLSVSAIVLIILWLVKIAVKGSASFFVGKFDLVVFLLGAVTLVSTIIMTPNKMEAFLLPGNATIILAGVALYFIFNQLGKTAKTGLMYSLFISTLLLSLTVLFTEIGLFSKIPQLPAFVKDVNFNAFGGNLPSIIYIASLLPLLVAFVLKEKDLVKKLFFGVTTAVTILGFAVLIKNALPGKPQSPRYPDYKTSWAITLEALKETPAGGVGVSNYLTAFNKFRPVTYNNSDLWQVRFTTASDFYLTLITEMGFAGLFVLAALLIIVYKWFAKEYSLEKSTVVILLVLMGIFPGSVLLLVLLFVLLSIFSNSDAKSVSLNLVAKDAMGDKSISSRIPMILASLPILVGLGFLIFVGSKAVASEYKLKKSLDSLSANDAKSTYNLMQQAINLNPTVDRYHASLTQINMALASSIAAKKDLTADDKNTISQLVQQAINEGKATVTLNPQRSGNWEVLAQVYRSIMPFAQGADQFAVQTYTQAVALDPTNPNLRIALGGVYYALGMYDNAIDAFKLAVISKPDLANAHYNLAVAFREKKDFDNAIAEMNAVISLVAKDSADYKLATAELDALKKNRPSSAKATVGQGDLQAPKPVGTSNVKPPITLPTDATPPTAQ